MKFLLRIRQISRTKLPSFDVLEEGDYARAVKQLHEKLHVPDKTNWQIRFAKIETGVNVKLPVGNIKDYRYVLMWMFQQVYKEFKEWTTSFHMILIGTANSKSLDSKKSKAVEATKAGDKPAHSYYVHHVRTFLS